MRVNQAVNADMIPTTLAREHDVVAMPTSYIFDRDGKLVTRHLGFKVKRQDEYEALLVETLNRKTE